MPVPHDVSATPAARPGRAGRLLRLYRRRGGRNPLCRRGWLGGRCWLGWRCWLDWWCWLGWRCWLLGHPGKCGSYHDWNHCNRYRWTHRALHPVASPCGGRAQPHSIAGGL